MADERPVQLPHAVRVALIVAINAVIVCVSALPLLEPVGTDTTHRAITRSASLPILMWLWSGPMVFGMARTHVPAASAWALGCALLWVHFAVAFHLGHGWSHQAAWAHTKQVGGYGDGIFVNYAFALVWLLDALWALVASASYRARPRWLHWAMHGFMAFVVLNAAVVFASWGMRFVFLGWVTITALLVRYARRKQSATHEPKA